MERVATELNPAGQYKTGRDARRILEESREQIADLLGADPVEVVFTSSGTEADNIAIQGQALAAAAHRGARTIVSTNTEHPAVLESVQWLCDGPLDFGFRHRELPVDAYGRVDPRDPDTAQLLAELRDNPSDTALLTCMWANNETGNINPVATILDGQDSIATHVDAVQVVGHLPIDFHSLGAKTLAASAHKFGGPRSTGFLLASRHADILSPIRGGGQERGLRSGTVNVQGAAGTAAALASAMENMERENLAVRAARDAIAEVARTLDDVRIWTEEPALPGHLHMSLPGAEGDSLIMLLDAAGVDASTGSACSSGVNRASHVLTAMGVDVAVARGALRLTVGKGTSIPDATRIAQLLPGIVEQARTAGMA